jgi:Zn-dependent oligopeptidase
MIQISVGVCRILIKCIKHALKLLIINRKSKKLLQIFYFSYFKSNNIKSEIFDLIMQLYDNMHQKVNISFYNDEIEFFEIFDNNESFLKFVCLDFHPRDCKQFGIYVDFLTRNRLMQEQEKIINIFSFMLLIFKIIIK